VTSEQTAQGAADAGRVAFRLARPATLRDKPDDSSPVLETLAEGSLVTVKSDVGAFLYVITAADRFGYIADETLVLPMQWSPEVERPVSADGRHTFPGRK